MSQPCDNNKASELGPSSASLPSPSFSSKLQDVENAVWSRLPAEGHAGVRALVKMLRGSRAELQRQYFNVHKGKTNVEVALPLHGEGFSKEVSLSIALRLPPSAKASQTVVVGVTPSGALPENSSIAMTDDLLLAIITARPTFSQLSSLFKVVDAFTVRLKHLLSALSVCNRNLVYFLYHALREQNTLVQHPTDCLYALTALFLEPAPNGIPLRFPPSAVLFAQRLATFGLTVPSEVLAKILHKSAATWSSFLKHRSQNGDIAATIVHTLRRIKQQRPALREQVEGILSAFATAEEPL